MIEQLFRKTLIDLGLSEEVIDLLIASSGADFSDPTSVAAVALFSLAVGGWKTASAGAARGVKALETIGERIRELTFQVEQQSMPLNAIRDAINNYTAEKYHKQH
jgi:hypothetical protein